MISFNNRDREIFLSEYPSDPDRKLDGRETGPGTPGVRCHQHFTFYNLLTAELIFDKFIFPVFPTSVRSPLNSRLSRQAHMSSETQISILLSLASQKLNSAGINLFNWEESIR